MTKLTGRGSSNEGAAARRFVSKMATGAFSLAAMLSVLSAHDVARAQPPAGDAVNAGQDASQRAEELAAKAFEHYRAGEYEQAVERYREAYDITPVAPILYNIARIYDQKLRDQTKALEFYRMFLRSPDAPTELIDKATKRVGDLREELARKQAVARSATTESPPGPAPSDRARPVPTADAEAGTGQRTAGWIAGGVGVLGVGIGTYFGLRAKSKNDEAADLCPEGRCREPRGETLTSEALDAASTSTVAFAVGGVGLVTAVVLLATAPEASDSDLQVEAFATPSAATFGVRGSF